MVGFPVAKGGFLKAAGKYSLCKKTLLVSDSFFTDCWFYLMLLRVIGFNLTLRLCDGHTQKKNDAVNQGSFLNEF